MKLAYETGEAETGRPQGSPLHIILRVGETLAVSLFLSPRNHIPTLFGEHSSSHPRPH